jgi:hypothetical protein
MIYTVGDSHCRSGFQHIRGINPIHLGPKLCFSIGRDGINLDRFNDGDTVILCFGEIDCRCHIHKYVTKETRYQQIIDEIVLNYFKAIKLSTQKKLRICIYNIVPPPVSVEVEDLVFPLRGSIEERISYVKYFNQKLKEGCLLNNYIFIDIYDKYSNSDGSLNMSLSDGVIHIRDKLTLEEELYKLNVLPKYS